MGENVQFIHHISSSLGCLCIIFSIYEAFNLAWQKVSIDMSMRNLTASSRSHLLLGNAVKASFYCFSHHLMENWCAWPDTWGFNSNPSRYTFVLRALTLFSFTYLLKISTCRDRNLTVLHISSNNAYNRVHGCHHSTKKPHFSTVVCQIQNPSEKPCLLPTNVE